MKNLFFASVILLCSFLLCACVNNTSAKTKKNCIINANGTCVTQIEVSKSDNGDYWEGAKKACGGEQNLPTQKDLANIASYIYTDAKVPPNRDVKGLKRNKEHFAQFDLNSFGSFDIWSSQKEHSKFAYVRSYYKKATKWNLTVTDDDIGVLAVCVSH